MLSFRTSTTVAPREDGYLTKGTRSVVAQSIPAVSSQHPLTLVSDGDLARMTDRAWREAARSWGEARAATGTIRQTLLTGAEAADAYWRDLRDEQDRRLDEAAFDIGSVEDRSSDTYVVATEALQPPAQGVTSPIASPMAQRFAASGHACRPKATSHLGNRIPADRS
jgi:hypothetical protein